MNSQLVAEPELSDSRAGCDHVVQHQVGEDVVSCQHPACPAHNASLVEHLHDKAPSACECAPSWLVHAQHAADGCVVPMYMQSDLRVAHALHVRSKWS